MAEAAEEGPSRPSSGDGRQQPRQAPPALHRLLLRVQCVELAGSAGAGGSDERASDEDGGGSLVSPRQSRRRALLGEGVCEVVALADTTARAVCR